MKLQDDQIKTLETAIARYGKAYVREFFGITQAALYGATHGLQGLKSANLVKLEQLKAQMVVNDSSAPIESDVSAERQLIAAWLQELSRDELTKVIAFIAEIRAGKAVESEPRNR